MTRWRRTGIGKGNPSTGYRAPRSVDDLPVVGHERGWGCALWSACAYDPPSLTQFGEQRQPLAYPATRDTTGIIGRLSRNVTDSARMLPWLDGILDYDMLNG